MKSIVLLLAGLASMTGELLSAPRPANIVLIFPDDQGYADVGSYGNSKIKTPHLDRMAAQGVRFTSFYVGQPVCSASRAALLTGCYANRVSIQGALGPKSKVGLHHDEITIAEALKPRGYATAIVGKWHLGDNVRFLPTRHGFDEYFGLPYSNDMWPPNTNGKYPPLPLIEGERVLETDPDQTQLTSRYTERAVEFIKRQKDQPFFLYLAHSMPHVPLHVSPHFAGKSGAGLYGDVLMEIDWSVGEILGALAEHGLDENTLVVFTSDNGPWLLFGDHAGSAGPLREGKGTTFEGGVRVPCIMRWPGKIPAGIVCREMAGTFDLFPTFASLAGAELPRGRMIDGRNIRSLMVGEAGAATPHEAIYFYWGKQLQAVRSGKWKLHFPHNYPAPQRCGSNGERGELVTKQIGKELFDLDADIGESVDVSAQHPDVVQRLEQLAQQARDDLGDGALEGRNVRPVGRVEG